MADKYKVLIGFNVKQEDGSEIRVEPGGKQFHLTNTEEKDGVVSQESKPARAKPLDSLLTEKQLKSLLKMTPPVLELVADVEAEPSAAETTKKKKE